MRRVAVRVKSGLIVHLIIGSYQIRRRSLVLPLLFLLGLAGCAEPCRTGFDVGSSGVRVGSSCAPGTARTAIDYLADVWADNVMDATTEATIAAFRDLPGLAGLPHGDSAIAGGYSAWRLALEKGDAERLVATLAHIEARSGVRLLVIPQRVEGAYGYHAARRDLGRRLASDAILDVGGGSLQIAKADTGWGAALGQRAWRQHFCVGGGAADGGKCSPNPVGEGATDRTQSMLAPYLDEARAVLGRGFTVTAVSAPVVLGVHPILRHLAGRGSIAGVADGTGFDHAALAGAIALLASRDDAAILAALDQCGEPSETPICRSRFVGTFVTDMLLLHGLMAGLDIDRIEVAEVDITNVPGLLDDPRARTWAARYPCYLERLQRLGVAAFESDPDTCGR